MTRMRWARFVWPVLVWCSIPQMVSAQDGPPPQVRAAIRSLEQMLTTTDAVTLTAFIADRLAPAYRRSMTDDALRGHLQHLRTAVGDQIDDVTVSRDNDGFTLNISGATRVAIRFDLDDAFKFTTLTLGAPTDRTPATSNASVLWDGVTWQTLGDRFRQWEAAGFSGVVIAQRAGNTLLRESYGMADPALNRPTALTSIYGIGSTPIDFTITGILLLAQRGQLALDDSLGKYFPDVPVDKRGITLRHLMTGRSGLRNFHGDQLLDWDQDLAWIDRATALQRIFGQTLLFPPGTKEVHSHSAFGVLAAVIEVVSNTTYASFVRSEILKPVGMVRTGFYGERGNLSVADFAVGAGPSHVGLPNIPPNWGPTSWLVMGSGGMYSTVDDMARYYESISAGTLLRGEWATWQQGATVGVGGSDRGYFLFHITNGRGDRVLGLMNGEGRAAETRAMMQAVETLVLGRR